MIASTSWRTLPKLPGQDGLLAQGWEEAFNQVHPG
jgi:hypothetical protein